MEQGFLPFEEWILDNPVENRSSRVYGPIETNNTERLSIFVGVSPTETITEQAVLSATVAGRKFPVKVTYNADGGRYPFIAYPKSMPEKTTALIGSFEYNDLVQSEVVLQINGIAVPYRVTRFNGIQNGSNIEVVW